MVIVVWRFCLSQQMLQYCLLLIDRQDKETSSKCLI